MASITELLEDINNLPDDKSLAMAWRDADSSSPASSTASDSGCILSSSSSVVGDDMVSLRQLDSMSLTNLNHNSHKKLNRSQSEPRGRYSRNSGGLSGSRYKTELCHPFEENGICKYGEKCQFAHGIHELRDLARHPKYKTELCRTFHAEGYCPYGARCHFIHERNTKSKPTSLCLYPTSVLSASSSSVSSLSPASSTAFTFAAAPSVSPPPSPIETRLPIFNEISYTRHGGLTA